MEDMIQTLINQQVKKYNSMKEILIKDALQEKGLSHLIDGIKNRIFPRIANIITDSHEYYFADDGEEEAVFLIAFEREFFRQVNTENPFDYKLEASLKYRHFLHPHEIEVFKNGNFRNEYFNW